MGEILKTVEDIENIIKNIMCKETNAERKELIMTLTDNVKIELISRIREFYITEKTE